MSQERTVAAALADATAALAAAGFAAPRREARLLVAMALQAEPLAVLTAPERLLTAGEQAALQQALHRRLAGEPASRIRGRREFWSLNFAISPAVLDPRPESELLVERAVAHVGPRRQGDALRILDAGTGSGCILLALLRELPAAFGIGVDRSLPALRVARSNAERLGVGVRAAWVQGDWLAAFGPGFDLIVANPPYIPSGALGTLERGVRRFDPAAALDGGPDGLVAYRWLVPMLPGLLRQGGAAFLEVGAGQAALVAELGRKSTLRAQNSCDLAGTWRCVALYAKFSACIEPEVR